MENKLISEVSRIHQIMGVKSQLNEQLSTFMKSLSRTTLDDFLTSSSRLLRKTVNSIDDMSEDEIMRILRTEGDAVIKSIRRNLYDEMTSKLSMTPQKFESMSFSDIMKELGRVGVKDPEMAGRYIKNYGAKNNVDTVDNVLGIGTPRNSAPPIGFDDLQKGLNGQTWSVDKFVRSVELDPEFGPLLKKSGKRKEFKELVELNFGEGVSEESLRRVLPNYFQKLKKIPNNSGHTIESIKNFFSSILEKKTLTAIGGAAFILLLLGVFNLKDVLSFLKNKWSGPSILEPETEPTQQTQPEQPSQPKKGRLDNL
jgi:hypothetical protein